MIAFMPRALSPSTSRRTNVLLPMAGRPSRNIEGCLMMPALNQLIGSQHTPAPVIRLRPTGTPSAGRAMSVPNGQNPPHTWFDVPKNSSIVGIRAA
jgi:hypothetical protein